MGIDYSTLSSVRMGRTLVNPGVWRVLICRSTLEGPIWTCSWSTQVPVGLVFESVYVELEFSMLLDLIV
jgi:hypothetical protein